MNEMFKKTFKNNFFKYLVQNCPTIAAPKNGHLISRNGSYAYYSCCLDYVFEDTKQSEKVLYCKYGNHWNTSISKCIRKYYIIY